MNFLQFLSNKKTLNESMEYVTEAFKLDDVDKAHELMLKLFKDKISNDVIMIGVPVVTKVDGKDCISITFLKRDGKNIDIAWNLNYLVSGKSSEVYSIDFFDSDAAEQMLFGEDETQVKTNLTIFTMGQSVAYFLPLVIHVANTKDFSLGKKDAQDIVTKKAFANEARDFNIGAQTWKVYESLKADVIENAFHLRQGHKMVESADGELIWETEAEDVKKKVRAAEVESWKTKGNSEAERRRSLNLDKEYREINKAIKGGATTLEDLEIALGHKISVVYNTGDGVKEAEKEIKSEKGKKDPDQAFKEMQGYVKTVIKGLQPGVILCGAPGVGKTYRVLQQLKANGYEHGKNLKIIKGKCTPRALYLDMYDYKAKGNIILIDDADSLVGPKAPEDVINILKAALDSTSDDEGRLVSYKVSGKLEDEEGNPVPKEFYFNASMIVITNYSVGQLDTALRGRVFTQSLDFTTEQLLGIIKKIMPAIDPTRLSSASKQKAYDYLLELSKNGADMEISIRSFATCARLFQVCEGDPDFNDDDARSMIAEQLENQFKRGGKKY